MHHDNGQLFFTTLDKPNDSNEKKKKNENFGGSRYLEAV